MLIAVNRDSRWHCQAIDSSTFSNLISASLGPNSSISAATLNRIVGSSNICKYVMITCHSLISYFQKFNANCFDKYLKIIPVQS